MITSLRLETHSASQGSTMLRTLCSKQIGRSVAAIYAVAAFFEANDTFDRSLALEERLERTGRIRYRYHGDQELPYAYGICWRHVPAAAHVRVTLRPASTPKDT